MASSLISDRNDFNYFYLQVTLVLPTRSGVSWPFGSGEKSENLLVTPMLPIKFQDSWPFVSGEDAKSRLSRWQPWRPSRGQPWRPSWISHWNILAIFYLQVTPMLPTKFHVIWPFISREEAKNRFWRWRPSWISDRNNFSYFWCTNHPDASYQVSSQLAFRFRRRSER